MPEFVFTMHNVRKKLGEKLVLDNVTMSFFEGATPALGAVARARMPQSPGFVRTKEFFYVNLDMVAKVDTTPTDDDDDVAQLFDASGTKIQGLIGAEAAGLRSWLTENGTSVV